MRETNACEVCAECEDTNHMLLSCLPVKNIWIRIEKVMNIQISWKTIILGVKGENQNAISCNNIISIVTRCIDIFRFVEETVLSSFIKRKLFHELFTIKRSRHKQIEPVRYQLIAILQDIIAEI